MGLSLCLTLERTCKIASVVEHGVGGPRRFQACLSWLHCVHSLIDGLLVGVQMLPREVSIRPLAFRIATLLSFKSIDTLSLNHSLLHPLKAQVQL